MPAVVLLAVFSCPVAPAAARRGHADEGLVSLRVLAPQPAVRPLVPATIEYTLGRDAETVTLEVLDIEGGTIRRFEGRAGPASDDEGATTQPPPAGAPPLPGALVRRAGVHRISWDLRYAGPTAVTGPPACRAGVDPGPLAVPGAYRVRVSALGQVAEVPLDVTPGPGLASISLAELRQRFDLARLIRERTSDAHDAVLRIRDLKKQIAERVPRATSPAVGLAADATARALSEVEAALCQGQERGPRDAAALPTGISSRLAGLSHRVDTDDAAPDGALATALRALSGELDRQLERLKAVEAGHVAAFNRMITNGGQDPIVPAQPPPRQ